MRTTLSLDDDVFLIARQRAASERTSIGDIISKFARLGIFSSANSVLQAKPKSKFGLLPARDETITSDHVYRLMEQEGM
ncbi:MAG: hypothetical protein RLZZ502_609 [Pseudomonadota bacterium]|jgi:hypothetical protein